MEGCKMSVRPVSLSITVNNDAILFAPDYMTTDYYNSLVRAHANEQGSGVQFCATCFGGDYLSPATHTVVCAYRWDGDEKDVTNSVTVCERHAQDEAENFFAIGK
jgi:hypothetical protein